MLAIDEKLSFEAGIERLEGIVEALEQRDVSLENALSLFQDGVSLIQHCNALLNKAEQVMGVLLEEDGELHLERALPVEG
ncbi:MAG: exodeoxyribonuclease VII small subunit [Desulfitobacteriaceae bacterium]|nr:exodeoxyribonuclease VII small subunit [Desulfitobacteriaceae bacterium]MDI6880098.1 exodeoxyribonuclease VII small subunit [Desulfitobacteriaceae bacterium]MDI6912971.1 exodeoxyribonuclease VII small subunit [Desulfitobacteriaceae bacterium]